jgi:hypothetical protein
LPGQHDPSISARWPNAPAVNSAHDLKLWIEAEIAAGRI